ncbi:hypothetical protein GCM10023080_087280 [Streptomyces pseudoechinosporeus]
MSEDIRQGVTLTERERDTACHAPLEKCHAAMNMFPYVRFLDPVSFSGAGFEAGRDACDHASRALVSSTDRNDGDGR